MRITRSTACKHFGGMNASSDLSRIDTRSHYYYAKASLCAISSIELKKCVGPAACNASGSA